MTRRGLTTTQRGYGHEHQQARAKALAELRRAGTMPCPFCNHDMTADMGLHYDHYPPLALGGGGIRRLAHARCNTQAGQRLGQQRRRLRTTTRKSPHTITRKPRATNSQAW